MKRVGWTCSYIPEEIIIASGFFPVRMVVDGVDFCHFVHYLPLNFCPYIRRVFGYLWNEKIDVSGLIFTYSCDGMRRLKDICSLYWEKGFVFGIDIPRRRDELGKRYFLNQLKLLKDFLEEKSGKKIKDEDLWDSIYKMNRIKKVLLKLQDMVLEGRGILSAKDLNVIIRESFFQDKDEFYSRLEGLFSKEAEIKDRRDVPRILLYGGIVEDTQLHEIVQECGAEVVLEDTCNSLRYFEVDVKEDKNLSPLEVLAEGYLFKLPCPRMIDFRVRLERILHNYSRYKCQGIIFHSLKFCDLTNFEFARFHRILKKLNIPVLHIEREEIPDASGQLKTRIQAFIELMRDGIKDIKSFSLHELSLQEQ